MHTLASHHSNHNDNDNDNGNNSNNGSTNIINNLSLNLIGATSEYFVSEGLYLVGGGSCIWLVVGRQCPLTTLRTVFTCFLDEDASAAGQGLAPGQGFAEGFGQGLQVPAAAVADRPRLSCVSLRYPQPSCDHHHHRSAVDENVSHGYVNDGYIAIGNTAATTAAAAGAGAGGDISLGKHLAELIQHLRGRSRYKQELRVVWSDEYGSVDSDRLGTRLVEDR